MSLAFEIKAKGGALGEISLRWGGLLFDGMEDINEELGQGYVGHYFYPEPAELRQRLAALQTDPTPIIEELKGRDHLPEVLQKMREFVDCYEKAFANKTEWKQVYRRLFEEEEKEREQADLAIDSAPPPDADNPSSSEDGESFGGQSVEWGDPSLMKETRKFEKTPSGKHRDPYIILVHG